MTEEIKTPKDVIPYWTRQLHKALVGALITDVRYTTDEEQKMM